MYNLDFIKELENLSSVENVNEIQMGILSPDEILRGSVCEITTSETYEGNDPKPGGLFDPRMGVIENGRICATCKNSEKLCVGHFGHIRLALPVYNFHYIDYIRKLMRCICLRCSRILVDINNPKIVNDLKNKVGRNRFMSIFEHSKSIRRCDNPGCMFIQPSKYNKRIGSDQSKGDSIIQITAEYKYDALKDAPGVKKEEIITPDICYNIFRKITAEDCEFLGFSNRYSRPEWWITTVLPVPPPCVRPSVRQDNNQRSEDHLTYVLIQIIKANKYLRQKIEIKSPKQTIDTCYSLLQYHCITYIDNEKKKGIQQSAQRTGLPLKTIVMRFRGKEGRLRSNIMGKRVDFSARTVITGDPNINVDEFGIPLPIAMNITFPEIVTPYNREMLYKIIRNGPYKHPGAKYVEKQNKNGFVEQYALKHRDPTTIILEDGDIVHRHLIDGDICLFNRQPSLHRMSMIAHKVKILPCNSFRLNLSVAKPFNADFDGDEMNMHVPQSLQTYIELKELTLVPTQIISPTNCKPIIYMVQDTLMGSYLMTKGDCYVSKQKFYNLMMNIAHFDGHIDRPLKMQGNVPLWSGKQLFSTVLPDITMEKPNKQNKLVVIKNGKLEENDGYMDDVLLGNSFSGLIQNIYNFYGPNGCKNFIDSTQRLVNRWLEDNSFTIGFGDCIPNREAKQKTKDQVEKGIQRAYDILEKAYQGLYLPNVDPLYISTLIEGDLIKEMDMTTENAKKIIYENMSAKKNNFKLAGNAGLKADQVVMLQIQAAVGKQDLQGNRIGNYFSYRTLPHFPKHDLGPVSRGYCYNGYIDGLDPQEYFFSAMSGRLGQIGRNVNTAETGYVSRRLMKGMEDIKVGYDLTIRDSMNNIIQFHYGDDNFDPVKLEEVPIQLIKYNDEEMKKNFSFEYSLEDKEMSEEEYWNQMLTAESFEEWINIPDSERRELIEMEWNTLTVNRDKLRNKIYRDEAQMAIKVTLPINIERVIQEMKSKFGIKKNDISNIHPQYILSQLESACSRIFKYTKYNYLFKIQLYTALSTKQVIEKHRLNKITFDFILQFIFDKMISAIIQPGEMVGPVAAQSIGEPSTQLTLDTTKTAGMGSKSTVRTGGVVREEELLKVTKDIKTPSMDIYLRDEYRFQKPEVERLMNDLEYTRIRDIIMQTRIVYENTNEKSKTLDQTVDYMVTYELFNEIMKVDQNVGLSPWNLIIEFNKEALMNKNIQMMEVHELINQKINTENQFEAVFTDDNNSNVFLKVRLFQQDSSKVMEYLKNLEQDILSLKIRGSEKIKRVAKEEKSCIVFRPDGSFENVKEWTLNTDGSNLMDILSHDMIDEARTFSNDINEIYEIFGIEAARNAIINEFVRIIEGVNYRHLCILADIMTYRGALMSIDRHGINRSTDTSFLSKATFEESTDILIKAAIFAETDKMKAVSANIMMGQFCKGGTNNFDVMFDEEKYIEHVQTRMAEKQIEEVSTIESEEIEKQIETEYQEHKNVNENSFEFGYQLNNVPEHKISKIPDIIGKTKIKIVKSKNQGQAQGSVGKSKKKVEEVAVAEVVASPSAEAEVPKSKKKVIIRKK
jgi:DNA-directed RNA polymerase II subunit RPB1